MTGVAVALILAFFAGYAIRADMALDEEDRREAETGTWRGLCAALQASRDYWKARAARNAGPPLPSRLGPDPWLLEAVEAVTAAMAPGERAGCLTVQACWKDDPDVVLIGFERGGTAAERLVRMPCTDEDGDDSYMDMEDDLPCAGSPEWVTGATP
jgi:hypothetical protein